jgi:hypothetical protein
MTFGEFAKKVRRAADRLPGRATAMTRNLALDIHGALVDATPVDTGEARSNWQLSLGGAKGTVIPAYAPGKNLGRSEKENAALAKAAAKATVRGYRGVGRIVIENNVEHIEYLNQGSSPQAGAGFVERTVAREVRGLTAKEKANLPLVVI